VKKLSLFNWFKTNKKSLQKKEIILMNDLFSFPEQKIIRVKHWASMHPYKFAVACLFGVLLSFIGVYHLPIAKADTVIFYPKNCLGGWQHPEAAEGIPETSTDYNATSFTEGNSAILQNTTAQIFCGEFSGEIPKDTQPTKIVLHLIWSVEDGSIVHHAEEKIIPSTTGAPSLLDVSPAISPTDTPVDATVTTPTSQQPEHGV
jgi:hypothetical protein